MPNKVIMTVLGGGPGYTLEDRDLMRLGAAIEHYLEATTSPDDKKWADIMIDRIRKLREPVVFPNLQNILDKVSGHGEIFPGEKDIIQANPQHRKCSHCGHEEDIYAAAAIPVRVTDEGSKYNLFFGSDANFCPNCDNPWGRNDDGG